jgi:hypothetical protein
VNRRVFNGRSFGELVDLVSRISGGLLVSGVRNMALLQQIALEGDELVGVELQDSPDACLLGLTFSGGYFGDGLVLLGDSR